MLDSKGATNIKIQKHSFYIRLLLGIILLVVLLCSCSRTNYKTTGESNFIPDKILINGKIITVDPDDSIAEAIAIKDRKIVAVGSNEELKKLIGPCTQVIDLHGLAATPGLSDSHCHFSETSMLYVLDLG